MPRRPTKTRTRPRDRLADVMEAGAVSHGAVDAEELAAAGFTRRQIEDWRDRSAARAAGRLRARGLDPYLDATA